MRSSFLAWIVRMPLIKRWAVKHLVKEESVAEHSHQVAVIAHMLAVIKNEYCNGDIVPEKAATIALYHEVSESKLQDIIHVTKYHNPDITKEFKKIEEKVEYECLNTLPERLQPHFNKLVVQSNVEQEYKKIVKAADIISAYIKASDEVKFQNPDFKTIESRLKVTLDEYMTVMPEVKIFMDTFQDDWLENIDD